MLTWTMNEMHMFECKSVMNEMDMHVNRSTKILYKNLIPKDVWWNDWMHVDGIILN